MIKICISQIFILVWVMAAAFYNYLCEGRNIVLNICCTKMNMCIIINDICMSVFLANVHFTHTVIWRLSMELC